MLHKRFFPVLLVAAVVAFFIIALAYVCLLLQRRIPPGAGIPDESQIESVRASLAKSDLGFEKIPEFTVPSTDVPKILDWLRPGTYEKAPPLVPNLIVGTLTIKTKQGKTINVTIYSAGHNPPLFTSDGMDYYWGRGIRSEDGHGVDGGVRLGKTIVQAHEDATQ
jgi:hypothetical protein